MLVQVNASYLNSHQHGTIQPKTKMDIQILKYIRIASTIRTGLKKLVTKFYVSGTDAYLRTFQSHVELRVLLNLCGIDEVSRIVDNLRNHSFHPAPKAF